MPSFKTVFDRDFGRHRTERAIEHATTGDVLIAVMNMTLAEAVNRSDDAALLKIIEKWPDVELMFDPT